jgi:hypothetical protein
MSTANLIQLSALEKKNGCFCGIFTKYFIKRFKRAPQKKLFPKNQFVEFGPDRIFYANPGVCN